MAIRLNQEAVEYAQDLIKGRQYEKNSDWNEAQPSAEEENKNRIRTEQELVVVMGRGGNIFYKHLYDLSRYDLRARTAAKWAEVA